MLAKLLEDVARFLGNSELFLAVVLTAIPVLLIARQPDLGTAVTLLPILLVVTVRCRSAGEIPGGPRDRGRHLGAVCGTSRCRTISANASRPSSIPSRMRGAGYQQIQARITVGSGGLWGKGFRQGTQGQLRLARVAQRFHLLGAGRGAGFRWRHRRARLYLFVIMRALEAAKLAKDRLGAYLVLGVLATFTFQVIYNITMSAGLAPVKRPRCRS